MCVEIKQTQQYNKMDITVTSNKKSYSVKKLLKQIFKQHKTTKFAADSMESLESLENSHNASLESDCASMESFENGINEQISAKLCSEEEEYDYTTATSVPVHFIRTEQGTFFWTINSAFDRWAQA
ncbi:enhancer of split m4 protein-like [Musca vetustissima]|uniref:enhancer of split m4 protein-like n=1 Tax=Musca vetustissima TaxID=27455 RepID=UPI002AB7CD8D|nr:enhancer of split m4 protein-like [Musca vetustissima]